MINFSFRAFHNLKKIRFFLILLYTLIIFGAFNSSHGKNTNFNYNAKNISSYFSALVSFDDNDYFKSKEFFENIKDNKKYESKHSSKHIQALISLNNYIEAEKYSKNLEKKNKSNFESNLILGLSYLKENNLSKAKKYFDQIGQNNEHLMVSEVLKITLKKWSEIDEEGISSIENIPSRYNNFKKIQKVLAACHLDLVNTDEFFYEILEDKKENYSRYYFFLINHLIEKKDVSEANKIIKISSKKYPKNLLINQLKKTLAERKNNLNYFSCKNRNHIIAEIFYVIANALSVQGNYDLSNFYVNLAKYFNPKFLSYNSLLAENYLNLKKYEKAKKIYRKLSNIGSVYKWHSDRQIAFILDIQDKKQEAIALLNDSFKNINPDVYQTYDFANFLKNRKKYEKSIKLYSDILLKIKKNHKLYPKILDSRGTAYERINELKLSEKDLLMSLEILPDQPYVMNYLAYSWLENGKNFVKALDMLKDANELKKQDGYITDSLGWALYKLNRFEEAKEYLKLAIILMPSDPIVNDHFADCLWKNDEKIQARYYWNYVLKLESTEEDLKREIKNKLIFGLEKS